MFYFVSKEEVIQFCARREREIEGTLSEERIGPRPAAFGATKRGRHEMKN